MGIFARIQMAFRIWWAWVMGVSALLLALTVGWLYGKAADLIPMTIWDWAYFLLTHPIAPAAYLVIVLVACYYLLARIGEEARKAEDDKLEAHKAVAREYSQVVKENNNIVANAIVALRFRHYADWIIETLRRTESNYNIILLRAGKLNSGSATYKDDLESVFYLMDETLEILRSNKNYDGIDFSFFDREISGVSDYGEKEDYSAIYDFKMQSERNRFNKLHDRIVDFHCQLHDLRNFLLAKATEFDRKFVQPSMFDAKLKPTLVRTSPPPLLARWAKANGPSESRETTPGMKD